MLKKLGTTIIHNDNNLIPKIQPTVQKINIRRELQNEKKKRLQKYFKFAELLNDRV